MASLEESLSYMDSSNKGVAYESHNLSPVVDANKPSAFSGENVNMTDTTNGAHSVEDHSRQEEEAEEDNPIPYLGSVQDLSATPAEGEKNGEQQDSSLPQAANVVASRVSNTSSDSTDDCDGQTDRTQPSRNSVESSRKLYDDGGQSYQATDKEASASHLDNTDSSADRHQIQGSTSEVDLAVTSSGDGMHPETPIVIDEFVSEGDSSPQIDQVGSAPSQASIPDIAHSTPLDPTFEHADEELAFSLSPSTAASSPRKQVHRRFSSNTFERDTQVETDDVPSSESGTTTGGVENGTSPKASTTHVPNEISITSNEAKPNQIPHSLQAKNPVETRHKPVDLMPKPKQSVLEKTLDLLDEEFSEAGESSASLLLALTRSETDDEKSERGFSVNSAEKQLISSNNHRHSLDKARALVLRKREDNPPTIQASSPRPSPASKRLSPLRKKLLKHRAHRMSGGPVTDNQSGLRSTSVDTSTVASSSSPKPIMPTISPLRAGLEQRLHITNFQFGSTVRLSETPDEPLDAEALYSHLTRAEPRQCIIDVTDLRGRPVSGKPVENESIPISNSTSDMDSTKENQSFFQDAEEVQTTKVIDTVVARLKINPFQSDSDDDTYVSSNTSDRKRHGSGSWESKSHEESSHEEAPKTTRVLNSVLDRLRLDEEKKESDVESDLDDLFQRYDSIVKDLVVLDDERLARAQAKQLASIVHAADSAVLDEGMTMVSPKRPNSPIRALSEIARRLRRKSTSPRLKIVESPSSPNNADKILAARFEERPSIIRSASFGSSVDALHHSLSVTSDSTHPSAKARQLRKQLEDALETSAQIRSKNNQLGEDILSAQSRMQERRNSSRCHSAPTSPKSAYYPSSRAAVGSPFSSVTHTKSFYHRNCCASSSSSSLDNNNDNVHGLQLLPRMIVTPSEDHEDAEMIQSRQLESIRSGLRNASSPKTKKNSPTASRRRRRKTHS